MSFFPFPQPGQVVDRMDPEKWIRSAQIIWGALLMGVVMFIGVTLMVARSTDSGPIPLIAVVFACGAIAVRFVVPPMIVRAAVNKFPVVDDTTNERLFPIYQTRLIVGMALLEGACFFNLIAYIVGGQWWTWIAVGTLLVLMALMFPSLPQFYSWAEDQKRDLQNRFQ